MEILYEDNHLIAVNKPFGMPSQGDNTGDKSVDVWTKEYIKIKKQKPGNVYLGLLHRLDRPAGGVLLMAKTSKAAARLSRQFQERKVKKKYYAITEKAPEPSSGKLTHYLKQLADKNIMRAYKKPETQAKEAKLQYRLIGKVQNRALLEVELFTGRKHQIRVQLGAVGCVIVGDVKYGNTDFTQDKSIALLSYYLEIEHPTSKEPLIIQAEMPKHPVWNPFQSFKIL